MKKELLGEGLEVCETAITKKHNLEIGWLELCGMLKEIRDKKLYEGRWDSFEDFLHDPQMCLDKSSASKMITIHEKFVIEYKMSPARIANAGGWSKVAEVLPVVKDKKSAEKWIDDASVLSKSDLRKEVVQERNPESVGCKHKNSYKVVMCCCRDCNNKEVEKYL